MTAGNYFPSLSEREDLANHHTFNYGAHTIFVHMHKRFIDVQDLANISCYTN